jgi:lipid II isoglutaminyl synthase (glutamine-hydrolysing)
VRAVLELPLVGLYSVYNALGAAAAAHALGIAPATIVGALAQAGPAFGRQERFAVDGRDVRVQLAKNPTGLNEVIRALAAAGSPLHLLAALNDGVQDGRDVSWIYDADLERLAALAPDLVCAGDRAADLALRCAIAGVEPRVVEPDVERALDLALAGTPVGGRLEVVPTYTAMLRVREALARRAGAHPYWAGAAS